MKAVKNYQNHLYGIKALTDEFQISVTKEISREVFDMCNLSTGVYNKGVVVGRQEGWQEGRMEQAKETAYGLYDEDGFSPEKIAKRLKVSLDTVQKWLEERWPARYDYFAPCFP